MKVFALSGYKGSGKDTVAEYLVQNYNFTRFSFAEVLKDMVADQYGIQRTWLDDQAFKEKPLLQYPVNPKDKFTSMVANFMQREFAFKDGTKLTENVDLRELTRTIYHTPRSLAILEGSTKRVANPNYWVNRVVHAINSYDMSKIQLDDLRYKSEVDRLLEAFEGATLITVRINRFDSINSTDPSERDLDDFTFDYYIDNTKGLEDLHTKIDNLARTFIYE
jgi:hypothetical protein